MTAQPNPPEPWEAPLPGGVPRGRELDTLLNFRAVDGNAGPFYYHRYFRSGDPIPERDPLTREEAAVLLAGKERPP